MDAEELRASLRDFEKNENFVIPNPLLRVRNLSRVSIEEGFLTRRSGFGMTVFLSIPQPDNSDQQTRYISDSHS
jgi:hypothetical protein